MIKMATVPIGINLSGTTRPRTNYPKGGDYVTVLQTIINAFPVDFKADEVYRTTITTQSDMIGVVIEDRVYPMSVYNLQKATESQFLNHILKQYGV